MSDDDQPDPNPQPQPQNITHQVARLASAIDRLPPGSYVIRLEKGDRLSAWRAVIEEANVVRMIDLWR
jgi:hypothetical protein